MPVSDTPHTGYTLLCSRWTAHETRSACNSSCHGALVPWLVDALEAEADVRDEGRWGQATWTLSLLPALSASATHVNLYELRGFCMPSGHERVDHSVMLSPNQAFLP